MHVCTQVQVTQVLAACGSDSLLGVLDVLQVLVHRADLVHQVPHHSPQGPAVPGERVREVPIH